MLSSFVTSLSFTYNNSFAFTLLNSYEYSNDDSFASLLILALLFLNLTSDEPKINFFIITLLSVSSLVTISLYSFMFPASAITLITI